MLDRRSSSRCLRAFVHPLRTHTAHYAHKHTRKYMRREDFATTSCVPNRLSPLLLTLRYGYCCARANTAFQRFLEVANTSRLVSHIFRTRRECECERLVLGNILRQSQKFVSHNNYDSLQFVLTQLHKEVRQVLLANLASKLTMPESLQTLLTAVSLAVYLIALSCCQVVFSPANHLKSLVKCQRLWLRM